MGHTICKEGIKVDPKKVEVVAQWPRLTNVTEIRCFLGLAKYYRKFIRDFSKIAAPLTRLTRKQEKFVWNEACEQSFQKLKECLTSAPVVALPEEAKLFTVYYDASGIGLGCVLM